MIDLTKPIRRTYMRDGKVWHVGEAQYPIFSDDDEDEIVYSSLAMIEKNYENIPEKRKPREWPAYVTTGGELYGTTGTMTTYGSIVRVIEWPEGAELPEWPT